MVFEFGKMQVSRERLMTNANTFERVDNLNLSASVLDGIPFQKKKVPLNTGSKILFWEKRAPERGKWVLRRGVRGHQGQTGIPVCLAHSAWRSELRVFITQEAAENKVLGLKSLITL